MAKSTQYFYASTCPTLKTSHLPTPEVDFQQFQAAFAMGSKRIRPQESATLPELGEQLRSKPLARHKPGDHPLPTEFPDKKALLKLDRDWKPAGYLSNRVATAACFYLMEDRATKWKNACNAWAGTREQKKNMYLLCTVVFSNVCIFIGDGMRPCRYVFHEETHLSPSFQRPLRGKLGFFGYAAQGACLVQQCVGDKDGHFQWGTEYIEFWRKCNGLSRFLWVFSGLHDQWFCPDRCTSPLTNLNDGRS